MNLLEFFLWMFLDVMLVACCVSVIVDVRTRRLRKQLDGAAVIVDATKRERDARSFAEGVLYGRREVLEDLEHGRLREGDPIFHGLHKLHDSLTGGNGDLAMMVFDGEMARRRPSPEPITFTPAPTTGDVT